ncbi:MAG: sugar-binding protein [Victivallales bacterium]
MKKSWIVLVMGTLISAALAADDVSSGSWRLSEGQGSVVVSGDSLTLELQRAGKTSAVYSLVVRGGQQAHLAFRFKSETISSEVRLTVRQRWLDKEGRDVDEGRRALGFPPLARVWQFAQEAQDWRTVADNITNPNGAATTEVTFEVERSKDGKTVKALIEHLELAEGVITPQGIEVVQSGLVDAGPLSTVPENFLFGHNLASNAAIEAGDGWPQGWKIEGDNSLGAAEWADGGAYSGRRCLKVWDRGPFVKSWKRKPEDPYMPGGAPGGNYASAREEVSARWVSEPSPATPGTTYQAYGFVWFADRHRIENGSVNPIRLQFLDSKGTVIPYATIWDDWMGTLSAFEREGWVMQLSKPLVAPPQAVSVRVSVALSRAFFEKDATTIVRIETERRFVLVDNVALYEVAGTVTPRDAPEIAANEAFWKSAAAGRLPFVPSSPAHRPGSVSVESDTIHPGGIVVVDPSASAEERVARLKLSNLLADVRDLRLNYKIYDTQDKVRAQGDVPVKLSPYQQQHSVVLEYPADLPLGPYEIRYTLQEGGRDTDRGSTRLSLVPRRQVSVQERGRMDYPFSLWVPSFRIAMGTPNERRLGSLMDMAAMGKTWFGCKGPIYLQSYISIRDPAKRAEAVQNRIKEARQAIEIWRRYGVTPMGQLQDPQLVKPEDYPILAEVVAAFVSALKSDIHVWRYGTESMHGGVKELDNDTMPSGEVNAQSGRNYLIWGRQGTVRQYWAEYFIVHKAAKEADPTCLIGPQNASDVAGNVLRLYFQVGSREQLDIFGMNTYGSVFSIWPPNLRELAAHGAADTPIFVSEFHQGAGAECSPIAPDHLQKEAELSGRQVAYWASVLHAFPTFFHLETYVLDLDESTPDLAQKGEARPQLLAFGTMANNLGAGKFVAKYELPGAEVYVRQRSVRAGQVAVVVAKNETVGVELEVGAPKATICDLWGNRREVTSDNGVVQIEATKVPVYVMDVPEIRLAKSVVLEIVHATRDGASSAVDVVVRNNKSEPIEGTLSLIPDAAFQVRPASRPTSVIAPDTEKRLQFEVNPLRQGGDHRLAMRARLLADKRTYESSAGLNFHFAANLETRPHIDGDLADWPGRSNELILDRADQVNSFSSAKAWGGKSDLSGKVRLAWDKENLYLSAVVDDDVHSVCPSPGLEFTFDSIELLVDSTNSLSRSGKYTMLTLAAFPDKPRVRRLDGPVLPHGDVANANIAVARRGGQTFYEASIPWAEIAPGFKPDAGKTIGIALSVDDNDGGNTGRRCISWFSAVTEKNPAAFGDIVLLGAE